MPQQPCDYTFPDDHPTKPNEQCGGWAVRKKDERGEPTGEYYPMCYRHQFPEEQREAALRGSKAANKKIHIPPVERRGKTPDEWIVLGLERVITMLETFSGDEETARALVQALTALDRTMERQAARGANVMKIEVEYVNQWRPNAMG